MTTVSSREDYLYALKEMLPKNSICAELGVYRGGMARLILDIINPVKFVLIDPYGKEINNDIQDEKYGDNQTHTAYSTEDDYNYILSYFKKEIKEQKIIVVRDYSYNVAANYSQHYFDMIYIDACHIYKSVKRDLADFCNKLNPNGIMCGHDYDWEGVKQAVDEFCIENGLNLILLNKGQGFDWAIK